MPSVSEHDLNSTPISRAIAAALDTRRFTALEMAGVCGCSDRHIENVATGRGHLNDEKLRLLAIWLCKHGETRLAQTFLCSGYAVVRRHIGTASGDGKDELCRGVKALSGADDSIERGDRRALDQQIQALREVLANLEAERDHIEQ